MRRLFYGYVKQSSYAKQITPTLIRKNHTKIHAKTLDNFAYLCYHGREPKNMSIRFTKLEVIALGLP